MSGMSMNTSASTATTAAAAVSATASAMSMSMGGSSCKISMLWNWYTVDSCFIARSWHVQSSVAFAGSCIGVVLLVIVLELLRRAQREFDRYLHRANSAQTSCCAPSADGSDVGSSKGLALSTRGPAGAARLRLWQQLARAALFTVQFAVGYFVMLLAMYYNGYIIICIFLGAFLGAAMFQSDTYYTGNEGPETRDSCCN